MRRRPALEVQAAVGILRVDAVAERVALEVRKRCIEAKGRIGLDEVLPVERADDRPAEDVVFRDDDILLEMSDDLMECKKQLKGIKKQFFSCDMQLETCAARACCVCD